MTKLPKIERPLPFLNAWRKQPSKRVQALKERDHALVVAVLCCVHEEIYHALPSGFDWTWTKEDVDWMLAKLYGENDE